MFFEGSILIQFRRYTFFASLRYVHSISALEVKLLELGSQKVLAFRSDYLRVSAAYRSLDFQAGRCASTCQCALTLNS